MFILIQLYVFLHVSSKYTYRIRFKKQLYSYILYNNINNIILYKNIVFLGKLILQILLQDNKYKTI